MFISSHANVYFNAKKVEFLYFSEYNIHWNINILFFFLRSREMKLFFENDCNLLIQNDSWKKYSFNSYFAGLFREP